MEHAEFEGIKAYFSALPIPGVLLFVLPFALMLLSLALLPLVHPHFWESNRNKGIVSAILGLPVALFFLFRDWHPLVHTALDYAAFIALLAALFVLSGGIYIRGSFAGLPGVNAAFLLIGALLSNFIGTTGASMLLIRPLLRANKIRHHKAHIVVFFIFVVSNCSGLLTPLGDPPLFLGFLRGVSFGWTFHLWPEWAMVISLLLALFYGIDRYFFNLEHPDTKKVFFGKGPQEGILSERFGIEGSGNFVLLGAVVGLILISGSWIYPMAGEPILGEPFGSVASKVVQALGMAAIAIFSYKTTARAIHEKNAFGFGPIVEVAVLFAGIFITMVPSLMILETQGAELGITQPWQYFWLTGGLSSFLDNAPTYLTFTSLAKGALKLGGEGLAELMHDPVGQQYLKAISCGAVLMGANTYIGNGPNFMVKAIAEHGKVRMPGFFGYMLWSGAVLIPIFLLVTRLFFSEGF